MFWDMFNTTVFIIGGLLLYRFGPRIFAAFKRFDDENRARIERERADRSDHLAHFRHAIDVAGEQVEEIVEIDVDDWRTGAKVRRFLFEGKTYADRGEAEQARAARIGDIARTFYRELPYALSARKGDGKLK